MRSFPHAPRVRLAAVAGVTALGVLASPLSPVELSLAADDLKAKQKQVERQIDHAHDELQHSSDQVQRAMARFAEAKDQLADAKGELGRVRLELAEAQEHDREMQQRLETAIARLATARDELAQGRADLAVQQVQVTDTVLGIYEQGDPELLAFASLLDAQSPEDFSRRLELNSIMVGRETAAYDRLHEAKVELAQREEEVEAAKVSVAANRREAAAQLVVVEDLLVRARTAKERVDGLVEAARNARADAWQARQQDREVIAQLREREAQIKKQILAAARRAAARSQGWTGVTDGYLNYPVNGSVTSGFGYRTHPIYGYWGLHDGVDFGAGCGAPLFAGAGGTVLSTYYSSVYGNRLYLDLGRVNGKALTLVYNHLSDYAVGEGARVGRGDVVGSVGSTGWSTGCHLHFTVLVNGNPVDPMSYF